MKQNLSADQRTRELRALKDKADLLASIHSRLSDEYTRVFFVK